MQTDMMCHCGWTRTIQECDCVLIEDSEMPVRDCATGIVLVIMKN